MKVLIVGSDCKNGRVLNKNLTKTLENNDFHIHIDVEIDNSEHTLKKYNVKNIPCLIVDDYVVSQGRVLNEREIKRILLNS